jgi:hypothetical protein
MYQASPQDSGASVFSSRSSVDTVHLLADVPDVPLDHPFGARNIHLPYSFVRPRLGPPKLIDNCLVSGCSMHCCIVVLQHLFCLFIAPVQGCGYAEPELAACGEPCRTGTVRWTAALGWTILSRMRCSCTMWELSRCALRRRRRLACAMRRCRRTAAPRAPQPRPGPAPPRLPPPPRPRPLRARAASACASAPASAKSSTPTPRRRLAPLLVGTTPSFL